MKQLWILPIAAVVLFGCGGSAQKTDEDKASPDEFGNIAKNMGDSLHNAQNSLDVDGVYVGLEMNADGTLSADSIVLEISGSNFVKASKTSGAMDGIGGQLLWNEAGNIITLKDMQFPNQYFVGENKLFYLDKDGNRFTGMTAPKYVLTKQ